MEDIETNKIIHKGEEYIIGERYEFSKSGENYREAVLAGYVEGWVNPFLTKDDGRYSHIRHITKKKVLNSGIQMQNMKRFTKEEQELFQSHKEKTWSKLVIIQEEKLDLGKIVSFFDNEHGSHLRIHYTYAKAIQKYVDFIKEKSSGGS